MLFRSGSGNIAATFATTAQAQDLTATNVAMNPANVFSSLKAWRRVIFTSTFTASGGSATIRNEGPITLLSGTTANGACSVYHIAPFAGYSSTRYQQNPDWSRQVVLYARVLRQQASTNGVMRYLFGATAASGFAYETLNNRGIGFEFRGTSSRLWLICHNGTSLTQYDTGINGPTSDYNGSAMELTLVSNGSGTLSVTMNICAVGGTLGATATYTASTTGAPTNLVSESISAVPYFAVTNGGDTAQNWWLAHAPLISAP